jgi:hypothetical protein
MNRRLKRISILSIVIFVGQFAPTLEAQKIAASTEHARSAADELVGCWRLLSIETRRPNGDVIYPFYGKHPQGLLMYDRSGWMSVEIVSDPSPAVPTASSREEFLKATPAEKEKAIDGFYAYYGTWSVDAPGSTVTHHIQQSLYPAERGENGVRGLLVEGNRLILTAKTHEMGEDHERKLVWERIVTTNP